MPSQKFELHSIMISGLRNKIWGSASMDLLPDIVGLFLTLSSFSTSLNFNGAEVMLSEQYFSRFQGSLAALGAIMWARYKPNVISSVGSMVQNSNAFLGGLFSRNMWNKKERKVYIPRDPPLILNRQGHVVMSDPGKRSATTSMALPASDRASFPLDEWKVTAGATVDLDDKGFESVANTGSNEEMKIFVRRVVDMLVCEVVDEDALTHFASRYTGQRGKKTFQDLMDDLTNVAPSDLDSMRWVPISRGDVIPRDAIESGRTRADGQVWAGRYHGEAGKINADSGKMWNFWGHYMKQQKKAEILCYAGGHEWRPIRRGQQMPPNAVKAGETKVDGPVYIARLDGEAGKINVDAGKMWNFWGHHSGRSNNAEILIVGDSNKSHWIRARVTGSSITGI